MPGKKQPQPQPQPQLTLTQAVARYTKASAQQARKGTLIKVAADFVHARGSKDTEFKKQATANLAAVLTQLALEKQAAIPPQFLAKTKKAKGKSGEKEKSLEEKKAGILSTLMAPAEFVSRPARNIAGGMRKLLGKAFSKPGVPKKPAAAAAAKPAAVVPTLPAAAAAQ